MAKTYSAQITVTINASAEKVWDALTNPKIIKKYLYGTDTKTDWEVGHPIIWSGEWKGKPYEDKGVVLACEPNKLLTTSHWSPLSGTEDKPENYHIVTYELSSNGAQTSLTLTQSNSPTQEDADAMVNDGWKQILSEIKQIVEAGSD